MMRWVLPEGIADLLPGEAATLESLRRRLLDQCRAYGFELVQPPLIEYLDSLLIGSGGDLNLKTFKLVDQLTGRTLGVRADMTPQIARIDAHLLHGRGVTRLCYCGPVLNTRASGLGASREPIQLGAEIYGHAGDEADIEALDLMMGALTEGGVSRGRVDLSDLGLVRLLLEDLPGIDEDECFALLEARDLPELRERIAEHAARGNGSKDTINRAGAALVELARCHGPAAEVAARARGLLGDRPQALVLIDRLERIACSPRLARHHDRFEIDLDLAEVRGFRYHTGLSFVAYVAGLPQAIGRGGRYDGVGAVFGRARPATGFSLDLRELAELCEHPTGPAAIVAPWSDEPELMAAVAALRAAGEAVEQEFPGGAARVVDPSRRRLAKVAGQWQVRKGE